MEEELSLAEIDAKKGVFDIYIFDLNFTDEEIEELFTNRVVRISQINHETVENEAIYKKYVDSSEFFAGVLSDISNGQATVPDRGIKTYFKKIMDYVYADVENLHKVKCERFENEYKKGTLENLILRHIIIKFTTAENEFEQDRYRLMFSIIEDIARQKTAEFKSKKLVSRN